MVPQEALKALPILNRCFPDTLLAVFLYGSATAGGLRPSSDVDLLVVLDAPTTAAARKLLVAELMQISGSCPDRANDCRPIELIAFTRAELTDLTYPARCEVLYGEWLRERFEAGEVAEPHANPEYTLLLAQARLNARTLTGCDAAGLLPDISSADVRRAIRQTLPTLLASLEGDERSVLLTLVRMWRTLVVGDFVPKDVAADWALPWLGADAGAVIAEARDGYLGMKRDDWQDRRHEAFLVARELSDRVTATL
jgi:streptomycin 3"-adenylyltransferase